MNIFLPSSKSFRCLTFLYTSYLKPCCDSLTRMGLGLGLAWVLFIVLSLRSHYVLVDIIDTYIAK